MAAARDEEEIPEGIQKGVGTARFANEALPLRALNLSLGGTLVTVIEECGEIGA
jgi:hypothetical protein